MRVAIVAVLLVFALFVPLQAGSAVANACAGDCWVQISVPTYGPLNSNPSFAVSYGNLSNITITGIVFMVIHNSIGQTVFISTATLQLGSDDSGTAYPVAFGLLPGQYQATFFVTQPSGVAISTSSTASFTV